MAQRLFDPIGRCIYCSATDNLTDEHIIPSGMGGLDFLPDASCNTCAKEVNKSKQVCQRGLFWPLRIQLGLKSAHKHRNQPKTFPVDLIDKNGKQITVHVPPSDEPYPLMLPVFDLPGILRGIPFTESITIKLWIFIPDELPASIKKFGVRGIIGRPLRMHPLIRMLAKIAHAKAVAELKLNGFKPYLQNLILGKEPPSGHYIGCYDDEPIPAEQNLTNRVHLEWHKVRNTRFVCANIRFFANIGAPTYLVVVGEF